MKKSIKRIFTLGLIAAPTFLPGQFFPIGGLKDGHVKVRVVDDAGTPIEGVHVTLYSNADSGAKPGSTDTNGVYSAEMRNIYAAIGGSFQKKGYYKSTGDFWHWDKWGGVPPANTNFPITMKRIIEPVPLKYKEVWMIFPRFDEPVGFDLGIGDWVFPDGKGINTDMLIKSDGHHVSKNDYSFNVSIEFVGEHNGMQSFYYPKIDSPSIPLRSELPPPSIAPSSDYENMFSRSIRRLPSENRRPRASDDTRKWIYRIRTEVDEGGNIVSANYGWMTKDFYIGNSTGVGGIGFYYYYNPDPHSRSLEPKEIADRQNRD